MAAGAATALAALGLAVAPKGAASFAVGTLAYQLANGVAYAAFAAFVLEMVGHGAAVTTKYQLFVGASNFAISYVAALDGQGSAWGPRLFPGSPRAAVYGVLGTDAVATVAGVLLLGAVFVWLRRRDTLARPSIRS